MVRVEAREAEVEVAVAPGGGHELEARRGAGVAAPRRRLELAGHAVALARLLERERVLAVFRQDLQRGEAEPHGGKLATILRAVSRLRRRKGDTAATGASDATEPVGAAAEPGETPVPVPALSQ